MFRHVLLLSVVATLFACAHYVKPVARQPEVCTVGKYCQFRTSANVEDRRHEWDGRHEAMVAVYREALADEEADEKETGDDYTWDTQVVRRHPVLNP